MEDTKTTQENTDELEQGLSFHPEVSLDQLMDSNYLDYSMSVIVSRALPEVKDGLKPSQKNPCCNK